MLVPPARAVTAAVRKSRRPDFVSLNATILPSSECKGIGLNIAVQELDRKDMSTHLAGLPNQLIEALFSDDAAAIRIRISSVTGTGRRPIELHAETDRFSIHAGAEHEMQIASIEAVDNRSGGRIENGLFRIDGPVARERPLIQVQLGRNRVEVGTV